MAGNLSKYRIPFLAAGVLAAGAYFIARISNGSDALIRTSSVLFLLWAVAYVYMRMRSRKNKKDNIQD